MKIVIFGANGATGRLLTGQALAAGRDVAAVTRRPADFQIHHERLTVIATDVLDARAVDAAVEGADVVLSTLGTPFTRQGVNIYSVGVRNITQAMGRLPLPSGHRYPDRKPRRLLTVPGQPRRRALTQLAARPIDHATAAKQR